MKRATSGAKRASSSSSGRMSRKAVDLSAVREEIRNLVGNAAPEMVENGIAEANKGHYAAMKFLFELVGLFSTGERADQGEDDGGLAKTMFARLGVAEAEVTNVCPAKSGIGSDAVE